MRTSPLFLNPINHKLLCISASWTLLTKPSCFLNYSGTSERARCIRPRPQPSIFKAFSRFLSPCLGPDTVVFSAAPHNEVGRCCWSIRIICIVRDYSLLYMVQDVIPSYIGGLIVDSVVTDLSFRLLL